VPPIPHTIFRAPLAMGKLPGPMEIFTPRGVKPPDPQNVMLVSRGFMKRESIFCKTAARVFARPRGGGWCTHCGDDGAGVRGGCGNWPGKLKMFQKNAGVRLLFFLRRPPTKGRVFCPSGHARTREKCLHLVIFPTSGARETWWTWLEGDGFPRYVLRALNFGAGGSKGQDKEYQIKNKTPKVSL